MASRTVRIDASAGWGQVRTERDNERDTGRWVTPRVSAAAPPGLTVGGFGPQVSLVQEERASSAPLRDCEPISGEPRFVRLF